MDGWKHMEICYNSPMFMGGVETYVRLPGVEKVSRLKRTRYVKTEMLEYVSFCCWVLLGFVVGFCRDSQDTCGELKARNAALDRELREFLASHEKDLAEGLCTLGSHDKDLEGGLFTVKKQASESLKNAALSGEARAKAEGQVKKLEKGLANLRARIQREKALAEPLRKAQDQRLKDKQKAKYQLQVDGMNIKMAKRQAASVCLDKSGFVTQGVHKWLTHFGTGHRSSQ